MPNDKKIKLQKPKVKAKKVTWFGLMLNLRKILLIDIKTFFRSWLALLSSIESLR